jgi:hypothetical protein
MQSAHEKQPFTTTTITTTAAAATTTTVTTATVITTLTTTATAATTTTTTTTNVTTTTTTTALFDANVEHAIIWTSRAVNFPHTRTVTRPRVHGQRENHGAVHSARLRTGRPSAARPRILHGRALAAAVHAPAALEPSQRTEHHARLLEKCTASRIHELST